ncbi:MAG: alpha/beta hydrolase [Prevotellaceae bacterium]|jgi:pimeloyl-ACP methyl ester carboxylesterase|nr:alpha/beta hydrolase [Prevotellaceae bacterium]
MEYFKTCRNIPVYINEINEKGDRTAVFLHGYLETNEVWTDFVDMICDADPNLRIVVMDLPGHGLSGTNEGENSMDFMADVIADVFTSAKIEKATVTGHSMGGYVALAFAEKYPELVEKLCLFHSTPNPDSEDKKKNRDREIKLIREQKLNQILETSLPNMFASAIPEVTDDYVDMIKESAEISDSEGFIACLNGMKNRKDMNDFLAGFDKPLLMIFGKKDKHITEDTANSLITRFPKAEVLMLENSGHLGFIEEPEICLRTLHKFIIQ